MQLLKQEYSRIEERNYDLEFLYPTEEVRKKLRVVNRDRSKLDLKVIKVATNSLSKLVSDIGEGKVLLADLPVEELEALRRLLDR